MAYCVVAAMDEEIIASEIPELVSLLKDIPSKVSEVTKHVHNLQEHTTKLDFSTDKGISLLEVKYHLLLSYLINLVQLMVHKVEGQLICEDVCVDRLTEIRTVLEKIKPLDQRLSYQVDKLIKTSNTGLSVLSDPLKFKPNPDNLISKLPTNTTNEGDDHQSGIYVPPRVHAMPYDDEGVKRKSAGLKKGMKAALLEEIHEFSNAPQEESHQAVMKRSEAIVQAKEQEKYEEEYFVRLGKKRKQNKDGRHFAESLEDLVGIKNKVSKRKSMFSRKTFKGRKKSKK